MSLYVIIASENPVKRLAVKDAFDSCKVHADFTFKKVDSGVDAQPMDLEEMMEGARNRAIMAHDQYVESSKKSLLGKLLSVGVESGIYQIGQEWFDSCYVSIYDGTEYFEGLGQSFRIPFPVAQKLLVEGKELGDYFSSSKGGAIGALTGNRITRKDQIVAGVEMALSYYLNTDYRNFTPDQSRRARSRQY